MEESRDQGQAVRGREREGGGEREVEEWIETMEGRYGTATPYSLTHLLSLCSRWSGDDDL